MLKLDYNMISIIIDQSRWCISLCGCGFSSLFLVFFMEPL